MVVLKERKKERSHTWGIVVIRRLLLVLNIAMTQQLGHADWGSLLIIRPEEAHKRILHMSHNRQRFHLFMVQSTNFDHRLISRVNFQKCQKYLMVPASQIRAFAVFSWLTLLLIKYFWVLDCLSDETRHLKTSSRQTVNQEHNQQMNR